LKPLHRLAFFFLYPPTPATPSSSINISMERYPSFEFRPPRDFPLLPPVALRRRKSSQTPPYKDCFRAVKVFVGVPEPGGIGGGCGVPLRIDAEDEGYKLWFGIPTCVKREWRYRLSLQKRGTRHGANIALSEISTVHVHQLPNGLFHHTIYLDKYPERGLSATFWTGEGDKKAIFYPRYMLARHFPDLLQHRLIVLDASRDYRRTFLILQQQATILIDHLRQSTGNREWRDPFSICHGRTSYNENSFDAAVATAATRTLYSRDH